MLCLRPVCIAQSTLVCAWSKTSFWPPGFASTTSIDMLFHFPLGQRTGVPRLHHRNRIEAVLFEEGACEDEFPDVSGEEVIGTLRGNLIATEPEGAFGVIGTLIYTFPEGDIHVSMRSINRTAKGAIIGGTGDFRGATGEYSSIRLQGPDRRVTFKFKSGQN